MRGKRGRFGGGGGESWTSARLPSVFLLCVFFFLGGILVSSYFLGQKFSDTVTARRRESYEDGDMNSDQVADGNESYAAIPFQILSWNPRALYFPNFASKEQCESIIEMAKLHLKPSLLALRPGETAENAEGMRTSSGMFLSSSEDKTGVLDQIEAKIARATMIPKNHGETFNILRYEIGQRYDSHYDAFNPAQFGPQISQRIASFLLYLSDVEEGGETMFPFENGRNMDGRFNPRKCMGLKVKPRRGDGLLFYSLYPNGTIDETSLHGSCPVIKGEKWVATKWIRTQVRDY